MPKPLIAIPLILLLAALALWAAMRAWASVQFWQADEAVSGIIATGDPDYELLQDAQQRVDAALRFFSGNPDLQDIRGQIAELSADRPGISLQERKRLLEDAADSYRAAIAERPLWPYSWANLMTVKDKQGLIDREYRQALNQCAALGPWEPAVQQQMIRSGLKRWSLLSVGDRERILAAMDRALRIQPGKLLDIARRFNRPDLFCSRYLRQPKAERSHGQVERYCNDFTGRE